MAGVSSTLRPSGTTGSRAARRGRAQQAAGAVAAAGAGGPRGRAPNPFNVTLLARVWSLSEPRENKGGGQPRWGSGKHVCFKLHAGPEHDRKGDGRDACRGIADAGLLGGALAPMRGAAATGQVLVLRAFRINRFDGGASTGPRLVAHAATGGDGPGRARARARAARRARARQPGVAPPPRTRARPPRSRGARRAPRRGRSGGRRDAAAALAVAARAPPCWRCGLPLRRAPTSATEAVLRTGPSPRRAPPALAGGGASPRADSAPRRRRRARAARARRDRRVPPRDPAPSGALAPTPPSRAPPAARWSTGSDCAAVPPPTAPPGRRRRLARTPRRASRWATTRGGLWRPARAGAALRQCWPRPRPSSRAPDRVRVRGGARARSGRRRARRTRRWRRAGRGCRARAPRIAAVPTRGRRACAPAERARAHRRRARLRQDSPGDRGRARLLSRGLAAARRRARVVPAALGGGARALASRRPDAAGHHRHLLEGGSRARARRAHQGDDRLVPHGAQPRRLDVRRPARVAVGARVPHRHRRRVPRAQTRSRVQEDGAADVRRVRARRARRARAAALGHAELWLSLAPVPAARRALSGRVLRHRARRRRARRREDDRAVERAHAVVENRHGRCEFNKAGAAARRRTRGPRRGHRRHAFATNSTRCCDESAWCASASATSCASPAAAAHGRARVPQDAAKPVASQARRPATGEWRGRGARVGGRSQDRVQRAGVSKTDAAIEWIRKRSAEASTPTTSTAARRRATRAPDAREKLVVFAHHVSVMDALHTALAAEGSKLHGAAWTRAHRRPARARAEGRRGGILEFEPPRRVVSVTAGGVGSTSAARRPRSSSSGRCRTAPARGCARPRIAFTGAASAAQ